LENHIKERMSTIILASSSPRRKALLTQVKLPFEIVEPHIDEECGTLANLSANKQVRELARRKVLAVADELPEMRCRWVVGLDTLVELSGMILGKPANLAEARSMLDSLAGQTHHVHTGVALLPVRGREIVSAVCTTKVTFIPMGVKEIEFYLGSNEWQGVAGAYRIQERGAFFVESIEGSYSNVVGLPISLFYGMLRDCDYPFAL
jgi:septum formation protein